jgi:hypothetical protein
VLSAYAETHAPTTRRPDLIAGAAIKLVEFFGGHAVAAITATTCQDYVRWRSGQRDARAKNGPGKRVTVSTARRELVVLSAALRWCWKHGKLDRPVPVTLPPKGERASAISRDRRLRSF